MGLITKVASIMMLGGASSHQARAAGEGARGAAQADSAVTDGMLRWWARSAGGRRRP